MKLIITVIQAYDSDRLLKAVTAAGLGATKIVSTGGFLRMGNATILIGVDDDRVAECLRLVRANCEPRAEVSYDPPSTNSSSGFRSACTTSPWAEPWCSSCRSRGSSESRSPG